MSELLSIRRWRRTRQWPLAVAHRQEGQSLVEFSLICLILFMILLGIIGFSLIFSAHLSLNLAVNTAGRAAAVQDWSFAPETGYDQIIYDELVGSLIILTPQNIQSIIIYRPNADGSISNIRNTLNAAGNLVGTAAYPRDMRTQDTFIGVQVTYSQPVIVPFVSQITGPEMLITKSATFRIE